MNRWRKFLWAISFLMVGGLGGYAAAIWTDGAVPDFVQRLRYRSYVEANGAELRAALEASRAATQHATTMIARGGNVAASAALAQAIRYSRAQSLKGRTYPVPDEFKRRFKPFFPPGTLEKVRWTLVDGHLNLGTVLAGWYYREGAVTLGDVIVFSNMAAARHPGLFAHELTHVVQYDQLGVSDFARLYTVRWQLIEAQARRHAGRVIADSEKDGQAVARRSDGGDRRG